MLSVISSICEPSYEMTWRARQYWYEPTSKQANSKRSTAPIFCRRAGTAPHHLSWLATDRWRRLIDWTTWSCLTDSCPLDPRRIVHARDPSDSTWSLAQASRLSDLRVPSFPNLESAPTSQADKLISEIFKRCPFAFLQPQILILFLDILILFNEQLCSFFDFSDECFFFRYSKKSFIIKARSSKFMWWRSAEDDVKTVCCNYYPTTTDLCFFLNQAATDKETKAFPKGASQWLVCWSHGDEMALFD